MYLTHWHSRHNWSAPIDTCYNRKLNTLGKLYLPAISPHGPAMVYSLIFIHRHSIHNIHSSDQHTNSNNSGSNNKNISIIVLYTKGLSKRFKKTCNNFGIQVHLKGNNTIQTLLMAPKNKDHTFSKSGVIYWFKWPHSNCQDEYIGKSGRSFGDRLKQHLRAPCPIHYHSLYITHPVNEECFTIVGRESQVVTRTIKGATHIQVNEPSLNRNLVKYQLPHILD